MAVRYEHHGDRLIRCFAERASNAWRPIAEIIAARPDQLAVVDGDLRLSYGVLGAETVGVSALLVQAGVTAGDRVAVMVSNSADAIRALLAIVRMGAVVVPIGTRSREAELSYIFADAEPAAVIYGPEFISELPLQGPPSHARIDVSGEVWQRALSGGGEPVSDPHIDEEQLFGILYTSGTTGKPKGAMLTHLNIVHSCLHWREAFALSDNEQTLLCVPWAHVSGLGGAVMPFLQVGGTLVVAGEFKRRAALELASTERITHALMVPAMYGLCLLEPDLADFDLSAWRIAAYGGAPMPEPTIARFAEIFPDLAMCNCYGATETSSPATIMPPGEGTAHSDSIGKVVTCGDIRVIDEQGREVAPGEDGELWIGGPMVVPGYWRNPVATAASFVGGYWKSGDIGSVDADGFVRIADRKKDMIIRGGFKVYPAEVESVVAGLEGVVEAAVVGCPDELLGEGVVAFVSADPGRISERQVRDWCAARLSDYKVPGTVVVQTAPLPRNANGKIQKAELRERAERFATAVRVA